MFGLASYKKSTVRNAHPFLGSLQKGSGSEIQMYFSWNHSRVRVLFLVCNFFGLDRFSVLMAKRILLRHLI